MSEKNQEVIKANIAVHSKIASIYAQTEPQFRPENIAKFDQRLKTVIDRAGSPKSLLDLGCGTGFVINVAKKYVNRIIGVDVTRAMLDQVDKTGPGSIELVEHDTGTYPVEEGAFDVVTAYSFIHHLYDVKPTFATAAKALRKGGLFYNDEEPNFYFWDAVSKLDPKGEYDPIVRREIDAVLHKDDEMLAEHGIANEVFNAAEYGKSALGGYKEEDLRKALLEVGFSSVEFSYHWYLGQAFLVNDEKFPRERRLENAETTDAVFKKLLPMSRHLYKYVGFVAVK